MSHIQDKKSKKNDENLLIRPFYGKKTFFSKGSSQFKPVKICLAVVACTGNTKSSFLDIFSLKHIKSITRSTLEC